MSPWVARKIRAALPENSSVHVCLWWVYVFAAIGLIYGCAPIAIATPSPDWTADITGSCEQAGAVLELHSCPEARPRGTTWLAFCQRAQASQGAIDLDVGCIERATNLEMVRGCHVRCRK